MANVGLPRATSPRGSRNRRAAVLAVAAAALVTACTGAEVPSAPPDQPVLVQGREIYADNCVNCHGAAGGGGVGSKLDEGLVVERYPDPAEQIDLVANGVRAMPAFDAKLTEAEIEAVVRYTREVLAGTVTPAG